MATKSKQMAIRVTDKQHKAWQAKAEASGLKLNAYVRAAVDAAPIFEVTTTVKVRK